MAIKVPDASEVFFLEFALGVNTPNDQIIKLFVNNVTPGNADTEATYTEMSTLGYSDKTLTMGGWTIDTDSGVGTATYALQTWTFTAGTPVTVYGYYVVDSVSGDLLWAEKFDSGKVVQYTGDEIRITPTFTGVSSS